MYVYVCVCINMRHILHMCTNTNHLLAQVTAVIANHGGSRSKPKYCNIILHVCCILGWGGGGTGERGRQRQSASIENYD